MKSFFPSIFSLVLIFICSMSWGQQLAFPGAEGYGKHTKGGRGGQVIEVTNLNDSGEGSLRAAISASGRRTVVFRVSGTITLNSRLEIKNPYITIAGQTAPGDGICIRKYPLVISTDNVIVRYLRLRLGDESGGEDDALSARGYKNIILDHLSASWSQDETMSVYWCDSTTIQWCLISESLYLSNHSKGSHGYGGIWGGPNATYHHNLFAHHSSRNPRFASGCGETDFRNNVLYNWSQSTYGAEKDGGSSSPASNSFVNIVANYYKPGPATTSSSARRRIVQPSSRNHLADYGQWYVEDNYVYDNESVTNDNWAGGVQPDDNTAEVLSAIRSTAPLPHIPINQETAEEAYISVMNQVGAVLPRRDTVDKRIIYEVVNQTALYGTSTYASEKGLRSPSGIIDSQTEVGSWPELKSIEAPVDSDHDGMPDDWEDEKGLDKNDAEDRNGDADNNGYTNLEEYLNDLVVIGNDGIAPIDTTETEVPLRIVSEHGQPVLYPNPATTTLHVRNHISGHKVEIMSLGGQVMISSKEALIDVSGLRAGMYLVRVESRNTSVIQKLVKR